MNETGWIYCTGKKEEGSEYTVQAVGAQIHTSSDVLEAGVAAFPDSWLFSISPLDSCLDSDPVGRPRSCRTCERQKSKHKVTGT